MKNILIVSIPAHNKWRFDGVKNISTYSLTRTVHTQGVNIIFNCYVTRFTNQERDSLPTIHQPMVVCQRDDHIGRTTICPLTTTCLPLMACMLGMVA